ncbi:virulence factor TspB C-terminal domain-related protein [Acidithiobacillus thiooxidans]|uniref:virulence factor TspB C-terminal domain-related protein n=1 Tax=Acidithiobacillus thiooxidans TaxID=930 RepID=UPI0028570AC9|nr:virulence factor TspB C-terminal domain-related protein [Acidithiobacillus thiooxidans]MDR7927639.1 virulence factor TspB C-terminal domain-related protein [Acidithiobacillus thiooxidans]
MRTKQCSGFSCLSSLLPVLRIFSLNLALKLTQASGEGRGRSLCALPLLSLLLFSSFSFASSSISGYSGYSGVCTSSPTAACDQYLPSLSAGRSSPVSLVSASNSICTFTSGGYTLSYSYSPCSVSCSVPSGVPVGPIGSSFTPNSSGVLPDTFCDSSDDCDTESVSVYVDGSLENGGSLTNGDSCIPSTAPSSSAVVSNSGTSCPSGYSFGDVSGCTCINSSGDAIPASGSSSVAACNGGSVTSPTLSPVSPVESDGVISCPSGSDSITSSSGSVSCYSTVLPPLVSSGSSGSISNDGGSGGSSSFHDVPPVTNSSGQTVCPPGSSSISGSNGSNLTCIAQGSASGSGTSPTSSGTSATSSTGSATAPTSSSSYPSSVSMPSLASASVVSTALGSIGVINETTSHTCPSPVTFELYGHTFSIPFTYACTLAGKVRPIVIGVFSLASLLLIVK